MILSDARGNLMDRNFRSVNLCGWLIDEQGNIIDNTGRIKLMASQLGPKGQIPKLLNYMGKEYDILNIMGVFDKDLTTKEIILSRPDALELQFGRKNKQ